VLSPVGRGSGAGSEAATQIAETGDPPFQSAISRPARARAHTHTRQQNPRESTLPTTKQSVASPPPTCGRVDDVAPVTLGALGRADGLCTTNSHKRCQWVPRIPRLVHALLVVHNGLPTRVAGAATSRADQQDGQRMGRLVECHYELLSLKVTLRLASAMRWGCGCCRWLVLLTVTSL
jgi:hypothetical protein